MSASMNTGLFQDYFNKCPLVHVTGVSFHSLTFLCFAPLSIIVKTVMYYYLPSSSLPPSIVDHAFVTRRADQ